MQCFFYSELVALCDGTIFLEHLQHMVTMHSHINFFTDFLLAGITLPFLGLCHGSIFPLSFFLLEFEPCSAFVFVSQILNFLIIFSLSLSLSV
ncbi:hypothetical protein JHK85_011550 [Glycine max]|uniref:Uncharacterized protein n=1 Tax=Glycine max TaxID=3847 RepID=K7KM52_SOYBN|nr:hypothetical protein JHK87_011115 [Glycine soja]KAG5050447.1 hypothetical protein JHK85_011550 [Glycine max]KAG5067502.1 hypothetical protein JHK86_011233 [Glycine max]KAH1113034.1 hypothetical protein GYH30_010979 [Glycine max]